MVHVIRKGLDLPLAGSPNQTLGKQIDVNTVGVVADDYVGMRPTMLVKVGDKVKTGQPLFSDKKNEGVIFTSPGTGVVREINRGAKRKFESVVIDLEGEEEFVEYDSFDSLQSIGPEKATEVLLQSGLWPTLRTRPYSRSPVPGSLPSSIFVNAMDTNPLAPEPELVIDRHREHFVNGLSVLTNLLRPADAGKAEVSNSNQEGSGDRSETDEPQKAQPRERLIYVCTRTESRVPGEEIDSVKMERFKGPHPAGLSGTHIHFVDPVDATKTVWTVGYQDVISIGFLFTEGRIMTERTISIAGPMAKEPGLFTTRNGACLDEIVDGQLSGDNVRVISGSVLSGRRSQTPVNFLGRFHNQVSAIEEGTHREFLGWQMPGLNKFTVTRLYAGAMLKKKFKLNSNLNGGHRSMVPIGTYERVMPLDILPTQLLRALLSKDTESAQALGCLELDEEDLALCTFVCPGKYEYGEVLRENLLQIEKEG